MGTAPDDPADGLAKARKAIGQVMKHRVSKLLFNAPVDVSQPGLEDYFTLISNPMDFGTIAARLDEGASSGWKSSHYRGPSQVLQDVRLVFDNCHRYNAAPADAPTRKLCEEVTAHFEDKWQAVGLSLDAEPDDKQAPHVPDPVQAPGTRLAEVDVPAKFSHTQDGAQLQLRLLDAFSIHRAGETEELVGLEAITDGMQLAAQGLLRLPETAKSKFKAKKGTDSVEVVLDSVVDFCIHYGKTPSVWLITASAWYKLGVPSPQYKPLYNNFTAKVALCCEGVAALQEDPGVGVKALADTLVSAQARKGSRAGKADASKRLSADFVVAQLQAWQATEGGEGAGASKRKRADAEEVTPGNKAAKLLTGVSTDPGMLPLAGPAAGGSGRSKARMRELSKVGTGSEPPKSRLARSAGASGETVCEVEGGDEALLTPEPVDDSEWMPDSSLPAGEDASFAGMMASRAGRARRPPPTAQGSLLPKPDRKLTAEERHARELELRRLRYHAQKEAEAERVRQQRQAEARAKLARERAADEARGPPPPPTAQFRLPPALVPQLLLVWEFCQSYAELLQMPPFPLWRLEAAVLPHAHLQAAHARRVLPSGHAAPLAASAADGNAESSAAGGISQTGERSDAGVSGCDEASGADGSQATSGMGIRRSSRLRVVSSATVPLVVMGGSESSAPPPAAVPAATAAAAATAEPPCTVTGGLPPTDVDAVASGALLSDVHNALLNLVDGKTPLPEWLAPPQRGRRQAQPEPPPPKLWEQRTCRAILAAPEGVADEELKDLAVRLMYGDYSDTDVFQRVRILSTLMHLALATEPMRDNIMLRVEREWRTRRRGRKRREGEDEEYDDGGDDEDDDYGGPEAPPANAIPGSVEEWLTWVHEYRLGLRLPLGTDTRGQRYWALGGKAGAWRIWVEDESSGKWGWYEGESLDALLDWLAAGSLDAESQLLDALERAPIPRVPVPHHTKDDDARPPPVTGRELQARRGDSYRHVLMPHLRGEGNWPQQGVSFSDLALRAVDAMLGTVEYWFKGPEWVLRHNAVLDLVQDTRNANDLVKALLQMEGMLADAGALTPAWRGWQSGWRRSLAKCFDPKDCLLHLVSLQEHCRWSTSGSIPRSVFLKLQQDHRCTLWIPDPNTQVVLLRTGLLMHVERYMRQLGLLPPEPAPPDEGGGEEAGQGEGNIKAEAEEEEGATAAAAEGDAEGGGGAALHPAGPREEAVGEQQEEEQGVEEERGVKAEEVKAEEVQGVKEEEAAVAVAEAGAGSLGDSQSDAGASAEHKQLKAQWMKLRKEVAALRPVERYKVASIAYRRSLAPHATEEVGPDGLLNTASWPVCWLLLRPSIFGPLSQQPQHDIVVPLHIDVSLPDYMWQADAFDRGMRRTWRVDDRFRMSFAAHKYAHNKVTATATWYKGTILEVAPQPSQAPNRPLQMYDPWEALLVQWDSSATEEGAVEHVNPWEIEVDPDEERRIEEERRKAEEAAARAARAAAKSQRVDMDHPGYEPGVHTGPASTSGADAGQRMMADASTVSTAQGYQQQQQQMQWLQQQQQAQTVALLQSYGGRPDLARNAAGLAPPQMEMQSAAMPASFPVPASLHSLQPMAGQAAPLPAMQLSPTLKAAAQLSPTPKAAKSVPTARPAGAPVDKAVLDHLRQYDKQELRMMLTNYYRMLKGKFKIPIFAHQELDLHKVFWEVQHRGGYELVTSLKLWKDVCRSLGVDLRGQTSASYNMRLNYEKCLLEFERYLASGQYLADVSAGAAPSCSEYMAVPTRPASMLNTASPAVSYGAAGSDGGGVVQQAFHGSFALKIGGQVVGRLGYDHAAGGNGGGVAMAGVQQGGGGTELGGGSFTQMLQDDDARVGGGEAAADYRPDQQPWLRLVAPPGTAPAQQNSPSNKGWVAQVSNVPPVVQSAPGYYVQQLQPLPALPLGAFLQAQGERCVGLRLQRGFPETGQWVEAEVANFNAETHEHYLTYAAPVGAAEWVCLSHLSAAELRPRPQQPLPNYSSTGGIAAVGTGANDTPCTSAAEHGSGRHGTAPSTPASGAAVAPDSGEANGPAAAAPTPGGFMAALGDALGGAPFGGGQGEPASLQQLAAQLQQGGVEAPDLASQLGGGAYGGAMAGQAGAFVTEVSPTNLANAAHAPAGQWPPPGAGGFSAALAEFAGGGGGFTAALAEFAGNGSAPAQG